MKQKIHAVLSVLLAVVFLLPINIMPGVSAAAAKKKLVIKKQPVSVLVYGGQTAKATVAVDGDGLKYAWYYRDAGKSKFTKTKTFKGNTYKVEMNTSRHDRQVYCKITDKYGNTVKTNTVTLSMRKDLKIIKQPVAASAYSGKKAKVTVNVSGFGLKYTWYYRDAGKSTFAKTNTFKGNTYQVEMNKARKGRQVYCVITDKYGKTVKTDVVKLSLRKTPKITKQPTSVSAYNGKSVKVTIKAAGEGLKYTWYYKNVGDSTFSKTSTFKDNYYEVKMNAGRHGRQIYCAVTDKYGTVLKTKTVTLSTKLKALEVTCDECKAKQTGTYFDDETLFTQTKLLGDMPLTFEAVFSLTADDVRENKMLTLDRYTDYKETVLFSNDDTYEKCIVLSITEHGNPKLMLRARDVYRKANHIVFDKVNVFSEKPIHLAITLDHVKKTVKCYVNGELMQTIKSIPKAVKSPFTPTYRYAVAGDYYDSNPNHFIGRLHSLSVWTDVRTDSEVNFDAKVGIDTTDKALAASYDMTRCSDCMKKDLSSKKNHLTTEKLWLDKNEVEPVGDYDFSFAVIGDTQELSEDKPSAFSHLYEWLVENKQSHKIEYVLGLGDITQKSYAHEWEYAREQIYKLNGNIPYLLTRGNHDYNWEENGVITAGYNKTFNDGIYNKQLTGVMTEGDVSNAYRTINICGIDYLFLTLDFGPNADMIAWADSVVAAHPNHRVIVITHGYMYRDGTTLDDGDAYCASKYPLRDRKAEQAKKPSLDGDDMWTQFVSKHPNIQMVLSGHDPCQHVVYRQDKGEQGNTVTQMLIDPQGTDAFYEPSAMVAMFYFSDNGNRLTVRYYSVEHDRYGTERSQFTINLN